MKRFLSLLLAALMLLACGSALAETVEYKELGISIDFSGIEAKAANCPFLENYGILNQEAYVACMEVVFADLPRNVIETMDSIMKNTQDEAEDTGDYALPPQEMKAAALADIEMVRSEPLNQLRAAELFVPVNTAKEYIGKTVAFESVDLDGNVVRSAELFRDNRITMVNLWGTWCVNCVNEMGELAELHKRMREKGCGIVGVEYERDTLENVADKARQILADKGVTYPNVLRPEKDPIFSGVKSYPFTLFVDSEGRIITYPIVGAAVKDYEPTFEKLLAGEAIDGAPDTGSTENVSGEYRVIVYDTEGSPVKGVIVQLCDESTCSFQKTGADGIATFRVETPKIYDVHVGKVPQGYRSSDETYRTLGVYSDVNIFISKAE